LWYLDRSVLLMVLTYALCPQMRAHLWGHAKALQLSLLKTRAHFQTLAASWMQAIFQSARGIGAAFSPTRDHHR